MILKQNRTAVLFTVTFDQFNALFLPTKPKPLNGRVNKKICPIYLDIADIKCTLTYYRWVKKTVGHI